MSESDRPYLYLTTTGRKSGNPHEIEIWFVAHQGRFYLVAERRERADWVQNMQQNPTITFRVGEKTYYGQGRIVSPEEADLIQIIRQRMDEKYGWSDGLIVELNGTESAS